MEAEPLILMGNSRAGGFAGGSAPSGGASEQSGGDSGRVTRAARGRGSEVDDEEGSHGHAGAGGPEGSVHPAGGMGGGGVGGGGMGGD